MAKKKRPLARRPRPASGETSLSPKPVERAHVSSDDAADDMPLPIEQAHVSSDDAAEDMPLPVEQADASLDDAVEDMPLPVEPLHGGEPGADDEPSPAQDDALASQGDEPETDAIALDDALGDPNDEDDVYTGPTLVEDGPALNEGEIENIEEYLKGLVEAILFSSDKPQTAKDVARAARLDKGRVQELIDQLISDTQGRGVRLVAVADGYAFRTNPVYSAYVREFLAQRPVRLSRAQLETLAIIAYRQPLTRPEVDDIRGVDSGAVIKLLLERDLIRVLGKKDEPGRPMIYGTTNQFLELFSLSSLRDLPTLREFTELSDDSRAKFELEVGEPAPQGPIDFSGYEAFVEGEGPAVSSSATDSEAAVQGDADAESDDEDVSAPGDDARDDSADSDPDDEDQDSDDPDDEDLPEDQDDEAYVPPASAADEEEFPDDDDDEDDDDEDDDEDDDDEDDD